ncbi:hypothetical protein [Cryobacterium sp. MLB-32]|uniref:hypothetical protein n=1 Tax=Cryobacterium sp. MLB-32 TaxID=1529318 RepID=UPI001E2C7CE6|nr:hypothetical protein [Cryobacterium sp. MLB-32]
MTGEALGGGVMVAVAAVLWVAYLMPTWSRRREYLATERNAVRLQQTLRILAETAEVPRQVRLEANARTVAEQQKILAQTESAARSAARAAAQAKAKSEAEAHAAEEEAAAAARGVAAAIEAANRVPVPVSPAKIMRRLRRGRALSSLVLLTGVLCLLGGIVPVVATGSWLLLGMGVATILAAFLTLSRLAKVARTARVVHVSAPERVRLTGQPFEPVHFEEDAPAVAQTWTPRPLPRPMHLSRGSIAQTAMASVDAAAQLRRAAIEADIERRASQITAGAAPGAAPAPAPGSGRCARRG